MKRRGKTGLLILLALILFSFRKRSAPSVEVGEGKFHEFDTDGDLRDAGSFAGAAASKAKVSSEKAKSVSEKAKPVATKSKASISKHTSTPLKAPVSTMKPPVQMGYNDTNSRAIHLKSNRNGCCK